MSLTAVRHSSAKLVVSYSPFEHQALQWGKGIHCFIGIRVSVTYSQTKQPPPSENGNVCMILEFGTASFPLRWLPLTPQISPPLSPFYVSISEIELAGRLFR